MNINWANIIKLAASIFISQLAGIIGNLFTNAESFSWYYELIKPPFTPPDWVFGPVWISLYTLIGIALYLIWRQKIDNSFKRAAVTFFAAQLIFNALWSIVFFGMQSIIGGLIVIIILLILGIITTVLFFQISRAAAYLFLPYILWISYANLLNYSIWQLNS